MPWTCPACQQQVQHTEDLPHTDRVYRCPVCHLQMIFDLRANKMRPLPPHNGDKKKSTEAA